MIFALALWSLPALSVYHEGVLYYMTDSNAKTCHVELGLDVSDTLAIPSTVMFGDTEFTVTEIAEGAFYQNRFKVVSIPSTVKSIGASAFEECLSLASVELSSGLVSIGDYAFKGCISLECITLPATLSLLGADILSMCSGLQRIEVAERNPYYSDVEGVLFNRDSTILLLYPDGRKGSYTLPSSTLEIGENAFADQRYLDGVTLPEGLRRIGRDAFKRCRNLTGISFPLSLEEIGEWAFSGCSLSEVVLPQGLRVVDDLAFNYNESLETVRIYGKFDRVQRPFEDLTNIKDVYYVAEEIQADNGRYYSEGDTMGSWTVYDYGTIDWGFIKKNGSYEIMSESAVLHVPEPLYEEITMDKNSWRTEIEPWSYFRSMVVYDPTDDPNYDSMVEEITGDFSGDDLPTGVYTLGGVKVGSSTDGLPAGLYIVCRGSGSEKVVVR